MLLKHLVHTPEPKLSVKGNSGTVLINVLFSYVDFGFMGSISCVWCYLESCRRKLQWPIVVMDKHENNTSTWVSLQLNQSGALHVSCVWVKLWPSEIDAVHNWVAQNNWQQKSEQRSAHCADSPQYIWCNVWIKQSVQRICSDILCWSAHTSISSGSKKCFIYSQILTVVVSYSSEVRKGIWISLRYLVLQHIQSTNWASFHIFVQKVHLKLVNSKGQDVRVRHCVTKYWSPKSNVTYHYR